MEQVDLLKQKEIMSKLTIPATFISHKRSMRNVYPKYALLRIDAVKTREAATKYVGNAVQYIRENKDGLKSNMGVITRAHGNSGVLMAKFKRNLPPKDVGKKVGVKLYKIGIDEI